MVTGSEHSRKQIGYSVANGQAVTFISPAGERVTGYVIGMDDFHWSVVTVELETWGVHKAGTWFKVHPEHSYENLHEDTKHQLDAMVIPFRQWVAEHVLGQQPPAEQRSA